MRTKKKTVEHEKNRNTQKSMKSVRLMGMGVYGGQEFELFYHYIVASLVCNFALLFDLLCFIMLLNIVKVGDFCHYFYFRYM